MIKILIILSLSKNIQKCGCMCGTTLWFKVICYFMFQSLSIDNLTYIVAYCFVDCLGIVQNSITFFYTNSTNVVRFEILTVSSMKMTVIWVVAPCSLEDVYWRFRGACCVHHQCSSPWALMVEAASTSEMSVNIYQTTWCNNPEDSRLSTSVYCSYTVVLLQ
jgi:hypothetical protein